MRIVGAATAVEMRTRRRYMLCCVLAICLDSVSYEYLESPVTVVWKGGRYGSGRTGASAHQTQLLTKNQFIARGYVPPSTAASLELLYCYLMAR